MATLTTIVPNMPKRVQSSDYSDTYLSVPIREQIPVTSLGIIEELQKYNFLDKQEDIIDLTKLKIVQADQPVLVNVTNKEQECTKKHDSFSTLQQNIELYLQHQTRSNNLYYTDSSDYLSNSYVPEEQDNIPNASLIYRPRLNYDTHQKLDDSDAIYDAREILTQLHALTQEVHDLRSDFLRPNHRFHW